MKRNEDIPRLEAEKKIEVDIDFDAVNIRKRKRFPYFWIFLLILLAILGFLILKKAQNLEDDDFESNGNVMSEEAWQGAFASREIFEDCREASVSIVAEGRRSSGFVYSSDGWIATVEGVVNENVKGQIEVITFDGKHYFVDSFVQNRESGLILLKIDASGLKAVEIGGDSNIFAGEELFTFCSFGEAQNGGSLFSGKVSHTERAVEIYRADGGIRKLSLFQIGILLTEEGEGAPLFNNDGELVGIACARGTVGGEERYMIDHAFAFSKVKPILEAMKNRKRVNEDDVFEIIAE